MTTTTSSTPTPEGNHRGPKALSLGGLCEVKYQIDRVGLPSESCFFDYIVTPTVTLPKLLKARLHNTFARDRLVLTKRWDEACYKALDPEYGVSNVHDFEVKRSIGENCDQISAKFGHLARKFRLAMDDPAPLLLFHRVTRDEGFADADTNDLFEAFAAVREARRGNPFHLVFVTVDGAARPHQDGVSFYQRPAEAAYHWQGDDAFWDRMIADLHDRRKI